MDFDQSHTVRQMAAKFEAFMAEHVYSNEEGYARDTSESPDR